MFKAVFDGPGSLKNLMEVFGYLPVLCYQMLQQFGRDDHPPGMSQLYQDAIVSTLS
jgi:hypothetical protein